MMSRIAERQPRLALWRIVVGMIVLVLVVAACGGDDDSAAPESPPEDVPTQELAAPNLNAGPGMPGSAPGSGEAGDGLKLPGCADPDAEECPSPLPPVLDATASADGVQIAYPGRYWEALTGAEAGDALIVVQPSEANRFNLKGTFEVGVAESAAAVLDTLEGAEVVEWTAAGLGAGTVASRVDDEADLPLAVVVGVFEAGQGRAVYLRMTATGLYSIDFHHDVFVAMLDSLTLTE